MILLLLLLFRYESSEAANSNKITFDGKVLSYYYTPYYIDDIELIPAQALASMLNTEIKYFPSGEITCSKEGVSFTLKLGSDQCVLNGEELTMSTSPIYSNSTYYLPSDFIDMLVYTNIYRDPSHSFLQTEFGTDEYPAVSNPWKSGVVINLSNNTYRLNSNLMLISKKNPLPDGYMPSDLKGITDSKGNYLISGKNKDIKLKKAVFDAAASMFATARSNGLKSLVLSSGYRSYHFQRSLFINELSLLLKSYLEKIAWDKAASIIAPPGTSEHQTGLAMDLTTKDLLKTSDPLSPKFAQTSEGKWITENCWKYGFIIRYMPEKLNITGIIFEPWHLRFVGKPHAEIMNVKKMCLEEYLEYIKTQSHINYKSSEGKIYDIYYINAPSSANTLLLQLDKSKYDISGYGKSGYIITIERT